MIGGLAIWPIAPQTDLVVMNPGSHHCLFWVLKFFTTLTVKEKIARKPAEPAKLRRLL